MNERRFSEEEIALILQRAIELETISLAARPASTEGISLAELKAIAREAGICPAMVGRAASELEALRELPPPSAWGPTALA